MGLVILKVAPKLKKCRQLLSWMTLLGNFPMARKMDNSATTLSLLFYGQNKTVESVLDEAGYIFCWLVQAAPGVREERIRLKREGRSRLRDWSCKVNVE